MRGSFLLAWRHLLHNKLQSSLIVLTLALGIGANTAIFSVVNTLLFGPLPIKDVNHVVFTVDLRGEDDPYEAALLDAVAFKTESHSFTGIGLARYQEFRLLGHEKPERLPGAAISSDYLSTLGISPLLGRPFFSTDDRPESAPVALISESLWRRMFGGDASILGRSLHLNDRNYTVIGVLPHGFDLPLGTAIWVPLAIDIESAPLDQRSAHDFFLVARLRQGASLDAANREVRVIGSRLAETYPDRRKNWTIKVIPLRQQLLGDITGQIKPTLFLLMGVVGFLLLIACANVASLLLSRSAQQGHENAIQLALGANQRRPLLQMLTESLLLAMIGGVMGLLLARPVVSTLMALKPVYFFAFKDVFQNIGIDGRVLVFSFAVSLVTAALFGLAPTILISFPGSLVQFLKEGGQRTGGGKSGRRIFDMLLVVEIAVASILLIGAGLTVKSLQKLGEAKLGFRPDHALAVEMFLTESDYSNHSQRGAFLKHVLESVRALPGVVSAGTSTAVPLSLSSWDSLYTVEGKSVADIAEAPVASDRIVTPGYLQTLGVSLLEGRFISEQDNDKSVPVVVISKEFARRGWQGEDPVGKRVKAGHPPRPGVPWMTVIGVVDDVKEDRYDFRGTRPVWYIPYAQHETKLPVTLLVRTSGSPSSFANGVRAAIWALAPNQTVSGITTMENQIEDFLGPQRFTAQLSGLFAVLGLVLAMCGIYGVTSYSITQRTREFGIRMAVGARWGDLALMILGRSFRLAIVGLVLGSVGGVVLGRLLSSTLYEVNPAAPAVFVLPLIVLLSTTMLASLIPAARLSHLDPMRGLRDE